MSDRQNEDLIRELRGIREELRELNRILFCFWDRSQFDRIIESARRKREAEEERNGKNENIRKSEYSGF